MSDDDEITAAAERLLEHISCGTSCAYRVDQSTPDIRTVAQAAMAGAQEAARMRAALKSAQRLIVYHHATVMRTLRNGLPCPVCRGSTFEDAQGLWQEINNAALAGLGAGSGSEEAGAVVEGER